MSRRLPTVYDPLVPLLTFGAGIAVGAIIANNCCNWCYGGVYCGGGGFVCWGEAMGTLPIIRLPTTVTVRLPIIHRQAGTRLHPVMLRPVTVRRDTTRHPVTVLRPRAPVLRWQPLIQLGQRPPTPVASQTPATMERWQPDQSRLRTAGAPSTSQNLAQRGWASSGPTSDWQPAGSKATAMNRAAGSTSFPGSRLVRADFGLATGGQQSKRHDPPGGLHGLPRVRLFQANLRLATGWQCGQHHDPADGSQPGCSGLNLVAFVSRHRLPRLPPRWGLLPSIVQALPPRRSSSAFRGLGSGSSAWDSSRRGAASRGWGSFRWQQARGAARRAAAAREADLNLGIVRSI